MSEKTRCVLLPESVAIVLRRKGDGDDRSTPRISNCRTRPLYVQETGPGPPSEDLFKAFVQENMQCFWNPCLVETMAVLRFAGHLTPTILLVSGSPYALEVLRSAWARRVLRSPAGYEILRLGDIPCVEMVVTPQTQFAPLAEALCEVVMALNEQGQLATIESIARRLERSFPEMVVPKNDLLYRTLGSLIKERKLYHTGRGYCVVTPHTYRMTTNGGALIERQMLMTNEEAIVRLHCKSPETKCSSVQTDDVPRIERSRSLRLSHQAKDKISRSHSFKMATDSRSDSENSDPVKREKKSVFSRLFRRSHSHGREDKRKTKHASFSAQFPPPEWRDSHSLHLHSRSTQTIDKDLVVLRPNPKARSNSHSKDRHSIHVHPNVSTLRSDHQSRSHDTDPFLRVKSSSLPRRSVAPMEVDDHQRVSRTPSTRRHARTSSSPSHRRHLSEEGPEKLNNGVKMVNSVMKGDGISSPSRKFTRNLKDGCLLLPNDKINNQQLKTNVWLKDDETKASKDFGSKERMVSDNPLMKAKQMIVNETVDLEVNFNSKSLDGQQVVKQNKPNHTISIKTASSHRPVTITTVTSITTSLSQNAIKDATTPKILNDERPKSRSAENSPLHNNYKIDFSPTATKKKMMGKNLLPKTDSSIVSGGDDSGFTSISPDTSYHEIR